MIIPTYGKIIGYNGIFFANGDAILFFENELSLSDGTYKLIPKLDTTAESLLKWNSEALVEYNLYNYEVRDASNIYRGGEGSMGNEGCIFSYTTDGALSWYFFSDRYNPIVSLERVDPNKLIAISETNVRLTIDLNEPHMVSVVKP